VWVLVQVLLRALEGAEEGWLGFFAQSHVAAVGVHLGLALGAVDVVDVGHAFATFLEC
jgi:hypothetical protein